jgi:hypothetical protein
VLQFARKDSSGIPNQLDAKLTANKVPIKHTGSRMEASFHSMTPALQTDDRT